MDNVPDILKQKCEESDLIKPIELTQSEGGFSTGKFLTHKGINTEFFYAVEDNKFLLYETSNGASEPYHTWIFETGTLFFDAVYFPINETTKAIAVAIWDPSLDFSKSNYIALISLRNKQVVKKIQVPYHIECLRAIYDGADMPKEKFRLQKAFHENWPHILFVGCRNGLACLTHCGVENDEVDENSDVPVKSKKCIILSKLFTNDNDDIFTFKPDEGQSKTMKKSAAIVTGFYYIEKSRCLVIGYNFGGIVAVSLVTQKVQCYYMKDGAIEHFALQEPDDDPRPILYLWTSVRDNLTRQYAVVLMHVQFPQDEAKSKNPSDWSYEYPFLQPVMKWYPDNCSRFLSMRTIFLNKGQISDDRPAEMNESGQLNSSTMSTASSTHDTCLMLMTWIKFRKDQTAKLHGALFDLNMFYYKRLNPRIAPDGTIAKQFPFLSRFTSKDDFHVDSKDILDIVVRPQSFHRFFVPTIVTDTFDQLYYPSTFTFDAKVLTKYELMDIRVKSLQDQALLQIGNQLVDYYLDPKEPSEWLCALALTNRIPRGSTQEERVCILKALLHNAYHHSISLLLVDEKVEEEDRKFIVKWLWKEVEHAKTKFDEYCIPLFSGVSGLSTSAKMFVRNMEPLFMRVEAILKYFIDHCEPETEVEKEWINLIQMKLSAIQSLVFYAKMLNFSRFYKLLPESETTREVNQKIRANFEERARKAKEFGHEKLEITKLIQEIMNAEPEAEIWMGKSAEKWYPPNYRTLLGTLCLVNISSYAKLALLGYYFQDFDNTKLWTESNQPLFHHFLSSAVKLENFVEHKYKIERLWSDDDKAAKNLLRRLILPLNIVVEKKMPTRPEDMDNCPLIDKNDVERAKEVFMNFEYGPHEWNKFVISRRRFDLIIETPLPPMDKREPDDIVQCRIEVDRIRRQMPFLFTKIEPLPQEVVEKYREIQSRQSRQESNITLRKKQKPTMTLNIRPRDGILPSQSENSRKRDFFSESLDDEDFELRMATPAKRGRFQIPATPMSVLRAAQPEGASPIVNPVLRDGLSIRSKYMERIRKVMQSPAVMRSTSNTSVQDAGRSNRQFTSPVLVNQTPIQAPASILKSTTKKPPKRDLDGTPLRLRFELPSSIKPGPEPEALIFEESVDVVNINESIDVVPSEESSYSSASFSVGSPTDPMFAATPIRRIEQQRVEDVIEDEEEFEDTEEMLEEEELAKETEILEEDEPQIEEEEEPEVQEEIESQEVEEMGPEPVQELPDDATYTIEKRTSFEEQNPADSTTWPDDEQESMPQTVIAQDQPANVEEEQQMEERPDQQPVEQLPIIEERQEVAEDEIDNQPPVVPETEPATLAAASNFETSSRADEQEQVVPESDQESDIEEMNEISEQKNIPVQITHQIQNTQHEIPIGISEESSTRSIRIERIEVLEMHKDPLQTSLDNGLHHSFEEQDPNDVDAETSSKTQVNKSITETPKSGKRLLRGRPKKHETPQEIKIDTTKTPISTKERETPKSNTKARGRSKKTNTSHDETERAAAETLGTTKEPTSEIRYSLRTRGDSSEASHNLSETTKEWIQTHKRKIPAPRKRKTSTTFARVSPTKSVASAPSPEKTFSPARKSSRTKERSASEEPGTSHMKQNLSSKRKNQSILATSIFDLSPLHETNETEHQTRLSQPETTSTERRGGRGRPRKTTMVFEKEFNVSDVPLTSTPKSSGKVTKSPLETPKRAPTPEQKTSTRSSRTRAPRYIPELIEPLSSQPRTSPPSTPKSSKSNRNTKVQEKVEPNATLQTPTRPTSSRKKGESRSPSKEPTSKSTRKRNISTPSTNAITSEQNVALPESTRKWLQENKISNVTVKRKAKQAERTFRQNQTTRTSPEKRQATPEAKDVVEHDVNVTPRRSTRLASKQATPSKEVQLRVATPSPKRGTPKKKPKPEEPTTPKRARMAESVAPSTPKSTRRIGITPQKAAKKGKHGEEEGNTRMEEKEEPDMPLTPRRSARIAPVKKK